MQQWRRTTIKRGRGGGGGGGVSSIFTVTKNILYKKVGGIQDLKAIGGVKSTETRSYQNEKCNSPIFLGHVLFMC